MSESMFPVNPVMTGIAVAFRNKKYIADSVMPYVQVGKSNFNYTKYNEEDAFTLPNTLVGRKSSPNIVEFGGTQETDSCEDYFLDDIVPQRDIDNAPDGVNILNNAVEGVMNLVLLDREKESPAPFLIRTIMLPETKPLCLAQANSAIIRTPTR